MRAISEKLLRIDKIISKYEIIRDEFVDRETRLKKILSQLIEGISDDFKLSKSNSVRKLKFYSIVSRVKEPNSLSEKLIRNNDYNVFDNILQDIDNIDPIQLKNKLKDLDDIIGIKILTDLNIDTINMFKLISSSNFISSAKEKGILLDEDDLKKQPVPMKNGLNIYKIKCQFEDWKFELQIKSKLESAWGDMEHSIFYKDYKVTPVRDLAQQSMNHIGQLLIEIDDFLQEIRNANDNFSINSKVILFINEFEEKFSEVIRDNLNGISYNFKKIASICFNIKQINQDILNDSNINLHYQSFDNDKYKLYINYRNENFDLQIFESIILTNINNEITKENLEECLDTYFGLIKNSYKKMILENHLIQDEEMAEAIINTIFDVCIDYECNNYILNTKDIYEHIDNLKVIIDSIEVYELEKDLLDQIISVYTIFSMNGNVDIYCQDKDKDLLIKNLEQSKIEIEKLALSKKTSISSSLSKLISNLN